MTSKVRASQLAGETDYTPAVSDAELGALFGISATRVKQLRIGALLKIRSAILADPDLLEAAEEFCGKNLCS